MIEKMQRDDIRQLELRIRVSQWLLVGSVIGAIAATVAVGYNILGIWELLLTACFLLSAWAMRNSANYYNEELHKARMRRWLHEKYKHQGDSRTPL